ncbi:unnamed protein product [Bursaphelenchus okinawaensis]|uniref:Major facilitator superfamily (MFS) profile domain-containing protein n=1 Tax=Bursaphelenchus okinawaensis TaxID=465554 RepID=A0A811KYQ0_9BILA|nr:unnamed protein product [Bursaphelenchus okinawaensis]CAG9114016.1 unnamed protein product [Bursaphelenchus okinawaensis]
MKLFKFNKPNYKYIPLNVDVKEQMGAELVDSFSQTNPFIIWIFLGSAMAWCITAPAMMLPAFTVGNACPSGENCTLTEGSIINEFDLIGPRAFIADISTTAYMFGNIIGASSLARMADFFGRRPLVVYCVLASGLTGLFVLIIDNVYEYMVIRLIQGILFPGAGITCWCLGYESIGSKSRSYATLVFGCAWVLGYIALGPMAMWFHNWRHLTVATCVPCIVAGVVFYFFLPESFYFLISNKKEKELSRWLVNLNRFKYETAASAREIIDEHARRHELSETAQAQKKANFFVQIYSHKKLFCFTLIMTYLWVCDAICYYGLSLFSSELAGNKYLNYVLLGLIEVPSYIVSPYLLDFLGRRYTISGLHFLSAVGFVGALFVDYHVLSFIFWLIGKFGVACAFTSLYVYAAEIFPTHLRSGGIGACEVGARVGGTLAPSLHTLTVVSPVSLTIIFVVLAAGAGGVTLFLPETGGQHLPDSTEEVENLKKNVEKYVL